MKADKHHIQTRFRQALSHYDNHGHIQSLMADTLLALLVPHLRIPAARALEIGCGTGLLTRTMIRRITSLDEVVVNDLVPEFTNRVCAALNSSAIHLVPLPGDIETITPPGKYDLVISSATVHWLHDLPGFLQRIPKLLTSGGLLAISLFGPENLYEIRKLTGISLDYPDVATLGALVRKHLDLLALKQTTHTLRFDTPRAVLQHLRHTGVNALATPLWTRNRLQQFSDSYLEKFPAAAGGVSLTYHPVYLLARLAPHANRDEHT